jgi:class 3 adenylate cyclase/YHS domain-containing protein
VTDAPTNTFLFADLAGFTALTEAHGDEEAADHAAELFSCVRELLPRHDAEEVKTIGDAVMVRATDAEQAICLGLAIVDAVRALPRFPVVHVGMHTGPAVERGGDWFGATVNLAARVSATAGGNEVLISDATRQEAGQLTEIELERRGPQWLKNVAEPIVVHRALRTGDQGESVVLDPVCRMTVDPSHAAGVLKHDGVEYRFCSLDCAAAFAANPERYVSGRD